MSPENRRCAGILSPGSVPCNSIDGAVPCGHPIHRPDDPRSPKLLGVAEEEGVLGRYIAALRELGRLVDLAYARHLTINATGAIAAVLCEIDIPWEIMRGFA